MIKIHNDNVANLEKKESESVPPALSGLIDQGFKSKPFVLINKMLGAKDSSLENIKTEVLCAMSIGIATVGRSQQLWSRFLKLW